MFKKSSTLRKHLIDIITMLAFRVVRYADLLRDKMKHPDESRGLLRAFCTCNTDLQLDWNVRTLTI
jgi:hypothetical protein